MGEIDDYKRRENIKGMKKLIELLVVEPDYLPDSEVLAFNCVYTP
jgi:hypothetical protein